jgi:hypothetical protein
MTVMLNQSAFDHARNLIKQGKCVSDKKDAWSEDQPSTRQEDTYLQKHGFDDYSKWYLGIDPDENKDTKDRYKFPYGDFEKVHRCGVLAVETRAGQYHYDDIEAAAAELVNML